MSRNEIYTVAHNVIHLQEEPNNGAERVSQARMGQRLTALREENGWIWAEGEDTYRGWADLRWLVPSVDAPMNRVSAAFADLRAEPDNGSRLMMRLPLLAGVVLSAQTMQDWTLARLPDGMTSGWLPTTVIWPLPDVPVKGKGRAAAEFGRELRGTPYLWGGSSSFGLDCSGFVQLCYELCGITLRRDADIQRDDPRFVCVAQNDLQPGDLAFFGKPDRITHVGMHLEGNTFIHAAGGAGVILSEWGDERYSPSYVDARRLDVARAFEPVTRVEFDNR